MVFGVKGDRSRYNHCSVGYLVLGAIALSFYAIDRSSETRKGDRSLWAKGDRNS
ncbi:MAG: hypothetical protein WCF82_02250 [Microcoleus sp.]